MSDYSSSRAYPNRVIVSACCQCHNTARHALIRIHPELWECARCGAHSTTAQLRSAEAAHNHRRLDLRNV